MQNKLSSQVLVYSSCSLSMSTNLTILENLYSWIHRIFVSYIHACIRIFFLRAEFLYWTLLMVHECPICFLLLTAVNTTKWPWIKFLSINIPMARWVSTYVQTWWYVIWLRSLHDRKDQLPELFLIYISTYGKRSMQVYTYTRKINKYILKAFRNLLRSWNLCFRRQAWIITQ